MQMNFMRSAGRNLPKSHRCAKIFVKSKTCAVFKGGGDGAAVLANQAFWRLLPGVSLCFRQGVKRLRGRQQGEKGRDFSKILSKDPLFLTFRYVKDTILSGANAAIFSNGYIV
jgi:hypothetical protein